MELRGLQEGARVALELSRTGRSFRLEQLLRVGRTGMKPLAKAIVADTELAVWIALEKLAQVRIAEIGLAATSSTIAEKVKRR